MRSRLAASGVAITASAMAEHSDHSAAGGGMSSSTIAIAVSIAAAAFSGFSWRVSEANLSNVKRTQQISIFAELLKAHDKFGVTTGRPSREKNRDSLDPTEIHDTPMLRAVWDAYNELDHQIYVFEIAMPKKYTGAASNLREQTKFVYAAFLEGKFEELTPRLEQRSSPALTALKELVRNDISSP